MLRKVIRFFANLITELLANTLAMIITLLGIAGVIWVSFLVSGTSLWRMGNVYHYASELWDLTVTHFPG